MKKRRGIWKVQTLTGYRHEPSKQHGSHSVVLVCIVLRTHNERSVWKEIWQRREIPEFVSLWARSVDQLLLPCTLHGIFVLFETYSFSFIIACFYPYFVTFLLCFYCPDPKVTPENFHTYEQDISDLWGTLCGLNRGCTIYSYMQCLEIHNWPY